eukprot:s5009_g3.t1
MAAWGDPFIQTVQGAPAPDLTEFDKDSHGYILFNVNDMQFVLDHRALVQSNNSVHTLGQSQAGMYAYRGWIYKVPIVMTVDDGAVWDSCESEDSHARRMFADPEAQASMCFAKSARHAAPGKVSDFFPNA